MDDDRDANNLDQSHDPLVLIESKLFGSWLIFISSGKILRKIPLPRSCGRADSIKNSDGGLARVINGLFLFEPLKAALLIINDT